MLTVKEECYVGTDPAILGGEPIVAGTRTPVRAIVELWRMGLSPEEIPARLKRLRIAQVFGALSYYSDHMDQIHEYIRLNQVEDDRADAAVLNS
jgi:uncharacterized protein (DUF433 family)